ncbi:MAG: hypothetical protein J6K25_13805 [Thermoguttaceae bacterium]|nr:hypothetical protein [Thermoguttaceae bacterium]
MNININVDTPLTAFSGRLVYHDIEFVFVFDGKELRLIPLDEKEDEIQAEWLCASQRIETPFLIGKCVENRQTFIFMVNPRAFLKRRNSTLIFEPVAYVESSRSADALVDSISFDAPELDGVWPVNSFWTKSDDQSRPGVHKFETKDFDATTSASQTFKVGDCDDCDEIEHCEKCDNLSERNSCEKRRIREVRVSFCAEKRIDYGITRTPLTLNSALRFEFEPTNDYRFIYRLYRLARLFLKFLCYRTNVYLPVIRLAGPTENGRRYSFAKLRIVEGIDETGPTDEKALKKRSYIKQERIAGSEGQILKALAADELYVRHIPETYKARFSINAARFVMITAAFEWEHKRSFPDKVFQIMSSGKSKKISLKARIKQAVEDFDGVIGGFFRSLCFENQITLDYLAIAQTLAEQRNQYAHGDLEQDLDVVSIYGLTYLEWLIYAMQLRRCGVDDERVREAVADLFDLRGRWKD